MRLTRTVPASVLAVLVSHCGGSTAATSLGVADAGHGADAGSCEGTAGQNGPPGPPAEHRPTAVTCPRTLQSPALTPDGGLLSCTSDLDCQGDAGNDFEHCVENACGYDECLVDSDCPTGNLCVCNSDAGGGTRTPGNACVPAQCHVDADCGAGNDCSPSRTYCGGVSGFYCTSGQDTCVDPTTDCPCGGSSCSYDPTVGHFLCATNVCDG